MTNYDDINFFWRVNGLCCLKESLLAKTVSSISWEYCASRNGCEVSLGGSTTLEEPDPSGFIDFSALTLEEVVDWIKTRLIPGEFETFNPALIELLERKEAEKDVSTEPVPWEVG